MWLGDLLNDAKSLEADALRPDGGLAAELYEKWQEVGLHLHNCLGDQIEGVQALVAAGLLYNPYGLTGSTWHELGSEYGSTRSPEALERLRDAQEQLQIATGEVDPDKAVQLARDTAIWRIKEYSAPNWAHVKGLTERPETDLVVLLEHLCTYHEGCIEEDAKKRGKQRALKTAVALRAIFEVFSNESVTSGDWGAEPSGRFCTCLQGVYKIVGINATFRHYATLARDVEPQNSFLLDLKSRLTQGIESLDEHRDILSFTDRSR